MFLEEEAFDAAVKAVRQQVGQQLLQAKAQHAKWLGFLDAADKQLPDLIHLDWAEKDRDKFFAASKHGVKDLLQSGFQVYGKYEVSCSYFKKNTYVAHVSNLNEVATVM